MVKFNRGDLPAHFASCPVLCTACARVKVAPADLEEHAKLCTAVQVECTAADVQCPWQGPRKDLHGHTRACKFVRQQTWLRRISALEETNRALIVRLGQMEERLDGVEKGGKENGGTVVI